MRLTTRSTRTPTGGAARLGGRRLPWYVRSQESGITSGTLSRWNDLSNEQGVELPSPVYRRATHILWLLTWVLFGGLAFWWVPAYFREPHPIPWWFGGLALVARWAMVFNHCRVSVLNGFSLTNDGASSRWRSPCSLWSVCSSPVVSRFRPNHAVNTDAHRRRYAPWSSPVTLVR